MTSAGEAPVTSAGDDLGDGYRSSGFGRRLGFGARPALLIVDFVMAYLSPESPLYAGVEDELESAGRVLVAARAAGVPVFHTRVAFSAGGRDGGMFLRKIKALEMFVGDGEAGRIAPPLSPLPDEVVITKQYASAFFGTSLASTLCSLGVDTVICCGLTTSGCVRASAVDALQHGFRPIVVRDAVGDRDPRPHAASLFDLDAKYADVLGEAEVLAYLRSLAR